MLKKISEIESSNFLNEDNCYATINLYDDNDLQEMVRVGKIPNSQLEIHVEGGEGFVPHIHICKKSGKDIIVRVCIPENKYFREKDDRNYQLNSSERKALNNYLQRKIPYRDGTMWELLVDMWNIYNPSHMINPKNIQQPDYSEIKEPN